jgi:transposase InsO family protein
MPEGARQGRPAHARHRPQTNGQVERFHRPLIDEWAYATRANTSVRLAPHAVAEVDDSRAGRAGLDEFEIHPALALVKNGMSPPTSTG